ncbi:hypothetical protein [Breoghania sp.]|nr:hypothetical protein [Breoghania sp.]MDJ0931823.1 hypothetical protein [Breoghania sp.]
MQAFHRIRMFLRRKPYREVFARFARTLEQVLAKSRPEPRVRQASH